MKLIFKLLAVPLALAFTFASMILAFVHSASGKLFGVVSGLMFIGAAVLLFMGETAGGVVFMIAAFLASPFGLYAVAGSLVKLLGGAGASLKSFIFS